MDTTTEKALQQIYNNAKELLGDDFAPQMEILSNAIERSVGTQDLGPIETHALVCKVMKTDPVMTTLVMAAAIETINPSSKL